ncbi:MAG TPA: hypothetical protein VIV07_08365 [Sphingomicrobium sp.]
MIVLAVPAIALTMLQASVSVPTTAFRGCLREAAAKASNEKVGGDKIEDYLRSACTGQMQTLKDAIIAFRMKNGMGRKAAASDADMTVDDYVATPADNYKFMIDYNAPKAQPAAAPATPQPSSQPPKP